MPLWITATTAPPMTRVGDLALAAEQAGAADDRGADREQQGVAAAPFCAATADVRAEQMPPTAAMPEQIMNDRDADAVDRDAGPARGLVVAADRVDVPAVAGAARARRSEHEEEDQEHEHHPRHALDGGRLRP